LKSWVLLAACVVFMLITASIGSRVYRGKEEYKALLSSFGAALALYVILYELLPPSLGFIAADWLERSSAVGLWNGLLILVMLFHSFWAFTYACWTGPSIGLLITILRRGKGLTADDALELFGQAEPVNLVLVRRLPKLIKNGFVRDADGAYRLTSKGERYAAVGFALRWIINMRLGKND
jgi:hypothetical protein